MSFPFEPPDRFDEQVRMYDIIGFIPEQQDYTWNPNYDPGVHQLFWDYWYNDEPPFDRDVIEEMLRELLFEYGIDYADLWDWEAFREWYDSV